MDGSYSAPSLLTLYLAGVVFIVIILVLVSFILNSRRSARLENTIDDLQERLQVSEIALEDAKRSLDELFGRKARGELKVPEQRYRLEDIVFTDEDGEEHNLKDTISQICDEVDKIREEQASSLEGIQKDQQGLVHAVSQLKTLMAALPGNAAVSAAQRSSGSPENNASSNNAPSASHQGREHSTREARKKARAAQQQAARSVMSDAKATYAPQHNDASDDGMYDPQQAFAAQNHASAEDEPFDASFAQTASDIAKLVGTVDFSKIDPNAGPATIGEHMANAQADSSHASKKENQSNQRSNRQGSTRDPLNPLGMAFGADPGDRTHSLGGSSGAPRQGLPHEGTFIEVEVEPRPTSALNADKAEANLTNELSDSNSNLVATASTDAKSAQSNSLSEEDAYALKASQDGSKRDAIAVLNDVVNAASSIINTVDATLAKGIDSDNDAFASNAAMMSSTPSYIDEVVLPETALNDAERAALAGTFGQSEMLAKSKKSIADSSLDASGDGLSDKSTMSTPLSSLSADITISSDKSEPLDESKPSTQVQSRKEADNKMPSMERMYNRASGLTVDEDSCDINLNSSDKEPGFGKGLNKVATYESATKQVASDSLSQATDKTQLTIDIVPSESLDVDKLKVSVSNGAQDNSVSGKDITGDMSAANVAYSNSEQNNGNAPVVDMIYDEDYVRKQKDEKPFGIDIATLDKAHAFIEAGVSLTELSARTGLSEDELRLLYEVDENGKVIDNSAPFRAESDSDSFKSSDDIIDHSSTDAQHDGSGDAVAKADTALAVSADSPSAALDSDERAVIESIMGKKSEPSYTQDVDGTPSEVASSTDFEEKDEAESLRSIISGAVEGSDEKNEEESLSLSFGALTPDESEQVVSAQVDIGEAEDLAKIISGGVEVEEEKHEEEMLAESLANASAIKDVTKSNDSDLYDDEKDEEESLAQILAASTEDGKTFDKDAALESLESDNFEQNLEAIDRLADSIIKENLGKDKSRKAQVAASSNVAQDADYESALAGALGLSGDDNNTVYAQSARATINNSADAMGASQEIAHAMSFDNLSGNSEYINNLKADIDEELAEDSVTLHGRDRLPNAARMMSANTNTTARNEAREAVARAAQAEADAYAGALASDNNVESNAARAAAAAAAVHSARRKALAEQGRIGAVGSATSDRHEKADPYEIAEIAARTAREAAARAQAQAQAKAQSQSQAQPHAQAQAHAHAQAPVASAPMTSAGANVNTMVGSAPRMTAPAPARGGPLSIGAVGSSARGATNFSAVTAMNPGMSDVVAMAPMALGSIEAPGGNYNPQQGLAADENPADILSQVVAGGLNSVSTLSQDQLDILSDLQNNGATGPHYANYQARNAYGITRR